MRFIEFFLFLFLFFNLSSCQNNHIKTNDSELIIFPNLNNTSTESNEKLLEQMDDTIQDIDHLPSENANAFESLNNNDKETYCDPENLDSKEKSKDIINGIVLLGPDTQIDNIEGFEGIHIKNLCLPNSKEKLQKYLLCFIGKELDSTQIDLIKQAIFKFYLTNSHPLVIVTTPEQKIINGIIRFNVYESIVANVEIQGNNRFKTNVLKNFISVKKGQYVDTNKVVQDLYWMNKNPFRKTSVIFKPGQEELTTDVDYLIEDRRTFRIYAGSENTGFESTGKNRVYSGFNWGNVWDLDHILTFQYTTSTKFHRFQAYTASYAFPFWGKNLISVYGGYSFFKPSSEIADLLNKGTSSQASFRYTFPLLPFKQKYVQDFSIGIDYKKTNTNLTFRNSPLIGNSSIITQFAFKYVGNYETALLKIPLETELFVSLGNIFHNQTNTDFSSLRFGAKSRYIYAYFQYSPYINLPYDMAFLINFQAQLSSANLLSSEQFGLGGYNTIRGYEYREVNKDNGVITSLEYNFFNLHQGKHIKKTLKFLAFIDSGIGWDHKKTPEIKDPEYLIGVGPGIRYIIDPFLYLRIDWAYKLHKTAFEPNASWSRLDFGVVLSY